MQNSTSDNRIRNFLTAVSVCLFWLLVWQSVSSFVGKEILVASPKSVFVILASEVTSFSFWKTIRYTLTRIIIGFTIAVILSTFSAVVCIRFKVINTLLSPVISIIRTTPVASFILFLLVWCKNSTVPVIIVFLMVFPVIWTNVTTGIINTDRKLIEMAKVYEFTPLQTVKEIYTPSVMPYFISALINSIGLRWKSGVAAEVLCTPKNSIGKMIYNAKIYLETPQLFAWTITVIAISMLIEKAAVVLLNRTASLRGAHD